MKKKRTIPFCSCQEPTEYPKKLKNKFPDIYVRYYPHLKSKGTNGTATYLILELIVIDFKNFQKITLKRANNVGIR